MTKTLTEQWREGTLETGWYYTKHDDGKIYVWLCFKDDCSYIENPEVKEVLAPVPSYEKWRTLIDGDKGTLEHLKKILPMIEYNRVAYDYLEKVIEDMENDIKEVK